MKFTGMDSFNLFGWLPDRNGLKRKPDSSPFYGTMKSSFVHGSDKCVSLSSSHSVTRLSSVQIDY